MTAPATSKDRPAPVLSVRHLTRTFASSDRSESLRPGCHDVSFDLLPGETIGVVGESGSGKTTLGRCIAGLLAPESGSIAIRGRDLAAMDRAQRREFRRRVQIVFQNPDNALNPRMTAGRFVAEALHNFRTVRPGAERGRLIELAELVGLREEHADRYPHQLSGGQKQRVGLMRALACEPDIVVLDEPTSALDVSVQAQVLRTLRDIQARSAVSFILISHDVGVVRYMCSRILVMYLGRIVEAGSAEAVIDTPGHPYTRALVDAVPRLRRAPRSDFRLGGDTASRRVAATSCPLLPRCPAAIDSCTTMPPTRELAPHHDVACWNAGRFDRHAPQL